MSDIWTQGYCLGGGSFGGGTEANPSTGMRLCALSCAQNYDTRCYPSVTAGSSPPPPSNPFGPPPPPTPYVPPPPPPGPPPPPPTVVGGAYHRTHVDSSTTVLATDGVSGYTTYQLSVTLGQAATNIYTIFGDNEHGPLVLPAAYQVATPFGADVGGTNPAFFPMMPAAQYDSWISVGTTTGNQGELSSIGIPFASWTADHGITATNGAVFWMDPMAGPTSGTIVVGQLTVRTGWTELPVEMDAQGKAPYGLADWDEELSFTILGDPGSAATVGGGH